MIQRQSSSAQKIGVALGAVAAVGLAVGIYLYVKRSADRSNQRLEESYKYDPEPARKVDNKLIHYRQLGQIATGLNLPTAVAVDRKGRVLVGGDREVRVLSFEGKVQKRIELSDRPYCLAVAEDNAIYVGMKDHVEVYTAEGEKKATWAAETDAYFTSIAVTPQEVWVGDFGRKIVLGYDREGKLKYELGKKQIRLPSPHMDVAVDDEGLVWFANTGLHRMEGRTRTDEVKKQWGQPGESADRFIGCCNPSDFVLLADGKFVTSEKGGARVKVYTADGKLDCIVADSTLLGTIEGSMDLAVDGKGRVLVLDPVAKVVRIFSRKDGGA